MTSIPIPRRVVSTLVSEEDLLPPTLTVTFPPTWTPTRRPTETPTLTPTSTPIASGCSTTYTIRPGDTLYSIASRFNVAVADLMRQNGIMNPNLIYANQTLCIPGIVTVITPIPPVTPAPPYPVIGNHTVQYGETLECIGRAYQVLPKAIAEQNGLSPSQQLQPNTVLQIPNAPWFDIPPGLVCQQQFTPPVMPTVTPPPAATATPSTVFLPDYREPHSQGRRDIGLYWSCIQGLTTGNRCTEWDKSN